MKTIISIALFFITFTCLGQRTITGKVVRIADGDTITLLDSTNTQIRIRLFGIDCPETGKTLRMSLRNLLPKCVSRNPYLSM